MTQDYFSHRRSIRRFSDREVTPEVLDSILERAAKAPTCGTMQLYSVVVSRRDEARRALEALHFNQPAAVGAPVILTICADYNQFTRWCRLSGADPAYDNFLSWVNALLDAAILSQQIVTIAEMEGLGSCYLGTVIYNAPEISDLLGLPTLVVPVCCVALGYPAEEGADTERLPLALWRHDGKYRHHSDQELMELFKVKDDFEPNRRYVEENKKDSLAAVFTDIRYPRGLNEPVSDKLLAHLRDKGFLKDSQL